ncbi:hypothetical protein [Phenylobacterium sp.]|uniref:hypothetical protein n=1 Tax=Phenylobacterium sp. TaxID=1871053 RepID=UPI0027293230|nr:hypothetical protein [Phenylobacterium sp.]MDO8801487.1 hypothetical protein [Phenylobacterium sp.]
MILALLMSAALGGAEPPAGETAATEKVPVSAPLQKGQQRVKMICREDAPTGSRLSKRTCMSLDEWKRRAEEDQEAMRQMAMKSAFSDVRGR